MTPIPFCSDLGGRICAGHWLQRRHRLHAGGKGPAAAGACGVINGRDAAKLDKAARALRAEGADVATAPPRRD